MLENNVEEVIILPVGQQKLGLNSLTQIACTLRHVYVHSIVMARCLAKLTSGWLNENTIKLP